VPPATDADVSAAAPDVSAPADVDAAARPIPARTNAPVGGGRAPADVAGCVAIPGRTEAIVRNRATEASDAHVRNADATAAAAARERRPLADDDSANQRRGHERRDEHATNQMRMLRKK
jgi:hypothetical protein